MVSEFAGRRRRKSHGPLILPTPECWDAPITRPAGENFVYVHVVEGIRVGLARFEGPFKDARTGLHRLGAVGREADQQERDWLYFHTAMAVRLFRRKCDTATAVMLITARLRLR